MATGHFSLKDFGFVPMKDFSEPWDDAKLYKKYKADEGRERVLRVNDQADGITVRRSR